MFEIWDVVKKTCCPLFQSESILTYFGRSRLAQSRGMLTKRGSPLDERPVKT